MTDGLLNAKLVSSMKLGPDDKVLIIDRNNTIVDYNHSMKQYMLEQHRIRLKRSATLHRTVKKCWSLGFLGRFLLKAHSSIETQHVQVMKDHGEEFTFRPLNQQHCVGCVVVLRHRTEPVQDGGYRMYYSEEYRRWVVDRVRPVLERKTFSSKRLADEYLKDA